MTERLERRIAALESALDDVRRGLPEEVFLFASRITPLINVDLLIQDDRRRTLLTWRDDEFFGAGWHVPGGIIRYKETMAERIAACAEEELGAAVVAEDAPSLVVETIREQRSRGHFASLLFRCRLSAPPDEGRRAAGAPLAAGQWQWHAACPDNLLDVQAPYRRFFVP